MYNFVAYIPIRSGSKTIPNKNIRMIAGKPLCIWAAEAAKDCEYIEKVYVASDDKNYLETVWLFGDNRKIWPIERNPANCQDESTTEEAMLEFANIYDFEHIVLMQATSPLVTSEDLTGGIDKYLKGKYDSLISVTRKHMFIWDEQFNIPLNYNPWERPRRQNWDGVLIENGAFFITSREAFLKSRCRLSGKIGLYEMPEHTLHELDGPSDWIVVEELLKNRYLFN